MIEKLKQQRDSYLRMVESYEIVNPLVISLKKAMEIQHYVSHRYKNQKREPLILGYGQCLMFYAIAYRAKNYLELLTYTQYGKSNTVSIAVLERVSNFPEDWIITAPSKEKGNIIMRALQTHIFDNEYTKRKFISDGLDKSEYLLHSKSKSVSTFQISSGGVGRVRVVSADSKNKSQGMEASMGEGAPNVVCDESGLLNDVQEAGIARMLGGHDDSCYIKIGNPFYRNHFFKSWQDPDFAKVFIPWEQGVAEGRIAQEKIDKAREKPSFDVLYECKFPKEEMANSRGYMPLMPRATLDDAQTEAIPDIFDSCVYAMDVAGSGKNYSVITQRNRFATRKRYKKNQHDTMQLVGDFIRVLDEDKPKAWKIVIDAVGVGKGVYDRMREIERLRPHVVKFEGGRPPENKDDRAQFSNDRAMCYWRFVMAIRAGHKLEKDEDWEEIMANMYKIQSDRKIQLMPKQEMKQLGHESPDVADAGSMGFFVDLPEYDEFEDDDDDEFYSATRSVYNGLVPGM